MTKEITKASILQAIQNKFKLRELEPEIFSFSEQVVPVYDINRHLAHPKIKTATKSITSSDYVVFFTVPENENWVLHGYNVIFMTGTFTLAGVIITRPNTIDWFYLDLTAAQNISYVHLLPNDIILHPNENVRVYVDGYTATGDLELRIDVSVEEVR